MILTVACSACSTSFPVDPRKVPDEGVYARCSACEEVFFVEAAMPVASPAPPVTLEEEASDVGDDGSTPEPDNVSGATGGPAQTDEWVFEVESEVDTPVPDMERLDTVEEGLRTAREESPWLSESSSPTGDAESPPEEQLDTAAEGLENEEESPWFSEPSSPTGDAVSPPEERPDTAAEGLESKEESPWFSEPSSPTGEAASPPVEAPAPEPVTEVPPSPAPPSPAPPAPAAAPPAAPPPQPAAPAAGFTFGRRDPHEKASRLARVLVSDIITYNPERHQQALDGGTLKEDFEDEIQKSLAEYVEQVGRELADSTDYFEKALNEILARGQQIF